MLHWKFIQTALKPKIKNNSNLSIGFCHPEYLGILLKSTVQIIYPKFILNPVHLIWKLDWKVNTGFIVFLKNMGKEMQKKTFFFFKWLLLCRDACHVTGKHGDELLFFLWGVPVFLRRKGQGGGIWLPWEGEWSDGDVCK